MEQLEAIRTHIVNLKVQEALQNNYRLELGSAPGTPIDDAQREKNLTILFNELVIALGIERFMETPVEALDQVAVMTVVKNHDTRGIFVSLINSFIAAYQTPETSEKAFKCLEELESLKVAAANIRFDRQKAGQSNH